MTPTSDDLDKVLYEAAIRCVGRPRGDWAHERYALLQLLVDRAQDKYGLGIFREHSFQPTRLALERLLEDEAFRQETAKRYSKEREDIVQHLVSRERETVASDFDAAHFRQLDALHPSAPRMQPVQPVGRAGAFHEKHQVTSALLFAWGADPHQRLGQFLWNLCAQETMDLFFVEDHTLRRAFERRQKKESR